MGRLCPARLARASASSCGTYRDITFSVQVASACFRDSGHHQPPDWTSLPGSPDANSGKLAGNPQVSQDRLAISTETYKSRRSVRR